MEKVPEDHSARLFRGMRASEAARILSPIFFIQRNNRLVWDETSLIMLDMFDHVWVDQTEIVVDHCVDITLQVYLYLFITLKFRLTLYNFQDCIIRYQRCRYCCHTRRIILPGVDSPDIGFGRKASWRDDQAIPVGYRMTFKEALHVVSNEMILKLIVPEWAMGLTERLRTVHVAFDELEVR